LTIWRKELYKVGYFEILSIFLCLGVTGVITKPLEGARQGGVGGFFGGVGRGLVGKLYTTFKRY
jgi:hypothetical protein